MKTKFSGILTLFLAFVVQLTFAQEKSISGTISDENGLPLPGVKLWKTDISTTAITNHKIRFFAISLNLMTSC